MKLKNITDIDKFFSVVNSCSGDVYLVSKYGDKINLKSKLTQFMATATLFENSIVYELELKVTNMEDVSKLLRYCLSSKM